MTQEPKTKEYKCFGANIETQMEIWQEKDDRWGWKKYERNKITGKYL